MTYYVNKHIYWCTKYEILSLQHSVANKLYQNRYYAQNEELLNDANFFDGCTNRQSFIAMINLIDHTNTVVHHLMI